MIDDFHQMNISKVPETKLPFKLETFSNTYFLGSCFAENLYNKFDSYHLNSNFSPFGNIYNPISLSKSINMIVNNQKIQSRDLIFINGLYQDFNFYSKFGHENRERYLDKVNSSISNANKNLLKSNLLILTLGTAWVFEKDGEVVNNCHRVSSSSFNRRLLEISEIVDRLTESIVNLKKFNRSIDIVITLSPVRHLRDDATENSLSKSILRVAIDHVIKKTDITYFPSYEILIDELRDYRWYKDDLAHPSNRAVDYITNRFLSSCSSDNLKAYLKRATKLNSLLSHRVINSKSSSTMEFELKKDRSLRQLKKDYPELIKLKSIK